MYVLGAFTRPASSDASGSVRSLGVLPKNTWDAA